MIIHADIITLLSYIIALVSVFIVGFLIKLPLIPERPIRDSLTISIIFPTSVIALGLCAIVFELGWNGMLVGVIIGVISALVSKYLLEMVLPRHITEGEEINE